MSIRPTKLEDRDTNDVIRQLPNRLPKRQAMAKSLGWQGIIDILNAEHNCFLTLLDTLRESANRLKVGKVPDYHLILDILDYLTYYPDRFHHPREDLVFSHLLQKKPDFQENLERLIREHKTLSIYNNQLLTELNGIADGRKANRPELLRKLMKYISSYEQHIIFEKTDVFPLAEGPINVKEWRQIKAKTRFIDDPLFGHFIDQKYHRLQRAINSTLGDMANNIAPAEFATFDLIIGGINKIVSVPGKVISAINPFNKDAAN